MRAILLAMAGSALIAVAADAAPAGSVPRIKEGAPYLQVRRQLMAAGFQPLRFLKRPDDTGANVKNKTRTIDARFHANGEHPGPAPAWVS